MFRKLCLALVGVSLCYTVTAQDPPNIPETPGAGDPIWTAIKAITIFNLKGGSNDQQRKNIGKQWAIIVAQEAEQLLRSDLFRKIVGFIEENRELFEDIYEGYKKVSGTVKGLQRVQELAAVSEDIFLILGKTGETLMEVETFTAAEVEELEAIILGITEEVGTDFELLTSVFSDSNEIHLDDNELLELVDLVHGRLATHRTAILRLHRYILYINANRSNVDGRGELFKLSTP